MPMKRKYSSKRSTSGKKKRTTKKIPKKKGMIKCFSSSRPEIKYVDTGEGWHNNDVVVPDGGHFWHLNPVQAGTGVTQRIGNKYTLKSVRLRVRFEQKAAIDNSAKPEGIRMDSCYRCMIVYDRNANGVQPNMNDLVGSRGPDGAVVGGNAPLPLFYTFTNLDNTARFLILKDWVVDTGSMISVKNGLGDVLPVMMTSVSSNYDQQYNPSWMDFYLKLNDLEVICKGTTEQIGSISTGSLYFVVYPQSAGMKFLVKWAARLRFRDKA